MPGSLEIRLERPSDLPAIRKVLIAAFGQPQEADLVDGLRRDGALQASLVALLDGLVVGHLALSPIGFDAGAPDPPPLALAPVAVDPLRQRQGIGKALVRAALDEARRRGHGAVIVLGHPEYYPPFGFERASKHGILCPYPAPDDAFLALELHPGGLAGCRGLVRYAAAFSAV
ncbi:MAG: N-acetyltransferase [Planctomyces sp.]|nr:N-acetyltransferase [Planctomyces sp.]